MASIGKKQKVESDQVVDIVSRIETRLVNGMRQLGVDPCVRLDDDAIEIDEQLGMVYISNLTVTVGAILRQIELSGSPKPNTFDVVFNGKRIAIIKYGV
jgi:hypothetical protein